VDEVICRLTGYNEKQLAKQVAKGRPMEKILRA
jgi:hypothetical protein